MESIDTNRVRPARGYILIYGLSRGGTNLCAERLHGMRGVIALNETVSRLTLPGETEPHRGLAREAVAEGSLPPAKNPDGGVDYLCLNKINYSLRCHPQNWVDRIAAGDNTRVIFLVRNPFEIHRSRCDWVKRFKPQRLRWTEVEQLSRDWLEMCRAAVDLLPTGRACVMIHERTAEDRGLVVRQVRELCNDETLVDEQADIPRVCPNCGGPLDQRKRYEWDPNDWLYCAKCRTFLAGFGDYNFVRQASHEKFDRWKERSNVDDLIPSFRPWLGDAALEFFLSNNHLCEGAEKRFEQLIRSEYERHRQTPLDDILYPY